jgi:hypothetical protein
MIEDVGDRGEARLVAGACMVEAWSVDWLERDAHIVFRDSTVQPGEGASTSNCFNRSSVTPVPIPDAIGNLPRWPMGRLALSLGWSYLPAMAIWLVWFCGADAPEKVSADASRTPLGPNHQAPSPLVGKAGDQYVIGQLRHLLRRRSRPRGEFARSQTTGFRQNGPRLAIRTDTRELACRT